MPAHRKRARKGLLQVVLPQGMAVEGIQIYITQFCSTYRVSETIILSLRQNTGSADITKGRGLCCPKIFKKKPFLKFWKFLSLLCLTFEFLTLPRQYFGAYTHPCPSTTSVLYVLQHIMQVKPKIYYVEIIFVNTRLVLHKHRTLSTCTLNVFQCLVKKGNPQMRLYQCISILQVQFL